MSSASRTRAARALSPRRLSGVYVLIAMIVFFALATETFFQSDTAVSIASEQAVTAMLALGLTVALATGVFDLSIGGSMGLAAVLVSQLMVKLGWPTPLAIVVTLLAGAGIGLVNGLLVIYARIDSFIATLGTSSILAALIYIVSGNNNIVNVPTDFVNIAVPKVWGIPLPVFYVAVLALVLWYVLNLTAVGRRLYATGGGREVARLAGVPTNRYIVVALMVSGAVAAAAGILLTARLQTGDPTVGPSYLLPAFAAGFLGATQFRPGRFNVWGTVLAVVLLATGVKGLVIMGASFWVPNAFNGVALLLAVGLSTFQRRARTAAVEAEPDRATQPSAKSPAESNV